MRQIKIQTVEQVHLARRARLMAEAEAELAKLRASLKAAIIAVSGSK